MNQKLSLVGAGGCTAKYVGYYNSDGGISLVFEREGSLTLDKAMSIRDFPWNVEGAILGSESEDRSEERRAQVVRRISGQLFSNLAGIHGWSVVHRDVKGANLILAERSGKFKLLDLGAACDLFSRTNYDSRLQVFDPKYGPPEADITQAKRGEGGLVLSAGGSNRGGAATHDQRIAQAARVLYSCLTF